MSLESFKTSPNSSESQSLETRNSSVYGVGRCITCSAKCHATSFRASRTVKEGALQLGLVAEPAPVLRLGGWNVAGACTTPTAASTSDSLCELNSSSSHGELDFPHGLSLSFSIDVP